MNKKSFFWVFIGVVVVAVGIGFLVFQEKNRIFPKKSTSQVTAPEGKQVSLDQTTADLFPADIDIYYSFLNIKDTYYKVKNSNFWKTITTLPMWTELEMAGNLEKITEAFKKSAGIPLSEGMLLDLLGEEFSLGISSKETVPVITIITKMKEGVNFKNRMDVLLKEAEKAGTIIEEKYQNIDISFVKSTSADQPNLGVSILAENIFCLVLGGTIQNNKDIIDRKMGLKEGFLSNKGFTDMFGSRFSGDGLFYINISSIAQGVPAADLNLGINPVFQGGADVIRAIGGEISFSEGVELEIDILPNTEKMTEDVQRIWNVAPKKAGALEYIPQNSLFYTISTSVDFQSFFKSWKQSLEAQKDNTTQTIIDTLNTLKEKYNVDIENAIIPSTGKEFSVVCSALSAEGILPNIELSLWIEVFNKKQINQQMENVIAGIQASLKEQMGAGGEGTAFLNLEVEKEVYGDVEITELKFPLVGVGFTPCFAILDKFFVLASNVTAIKKFIDVKEGKLPHISEDPAYQNITKIIAEETNQVGFINVESVLKSAVSICEWIISFQKLSMPKGDTPEEQKRREEIETTEVLLRNSVIPLLKAFNIVKVLGSNTVHQENNAIHQSFKLYISDQEAAA